MLQRSTFLHATRRQFGRSQRQFISPSKALKADLVQDLYLKELRAYKPTPLNPADSDGQVHKFKAPTAPRIPDEGDIAKGLKAYEEQKVEVEGQADEGAESKVEQWFEEDEDFETPPPQ
ncbi:MAG: hypothetical protein LQ342_000131 [Letrouitia transgressa]|nr:MAG: hypothetical protein LQ342_000131 [Letrouitia transgressa]